MGCGGIFSEVAAPVPLALGVTTLADTIAANDRNTHSMQILLLLILIAGLYPVVSQLEEKNIVSHREQRIFCQRIAREW